jgi:hypothetical protein
MSLIFQGSIGPYVWYMGKRDRGRRRRRRFIRGGWKILTWSVGKRNGEKNMYFVCDFNGRWLKDSSFIYCFDDILNVEGRIILMIKVRCFLYLVSLHFF